MAGEQGWRFFVFCYAPGRKRSAIQCVRVLELPPADRDSPLAAAEAFLGTVVADPSGHPHRICGFQLARSDVPGRLPGRAAMLLVEEGGQLPSTRLHPPKLSRAGAEMLQSLLRGERIRRGPTERALRQMGLISPDATRITPLALRLFGSSLHLAAAPAPIVPLIQAERLVA